MPMPLPIGEPRGMTAAQPASSSRRARIGSSFVYGSTVNPSATSVSAAASSSAGAGRKSRPAIWKPFPLSTLHRLKYLHSLSVAELGAAPFAARHHLAVHRNRHAAALGRRAAGLHGVVHGGAGVQLARLAVEQDPHRTPTPKRSGVNGRTAAGGSP